VGGKGGEGVSLLLPALVLAHADLRYAPAQDLLPGENSGGTRWWTRTRAWTTDPEVMRRFRAETPGYC